MDEHAIEKCCLSGLGDLLGQADNDDIRAAFLAHSDRVIGAFYIRPAHLGIHWNESAAELARERGLPSIQSRKSGYATSDVKICSNLTILPFRIATNGSVLCHPCRTEKVAMPPHSNFLIRHYLPNIIIPFVKVLSKCRMVGIIPMLYVGRPYNLYGLYF